MKFIYFSFVLCIVAFCSCKKNALPGTAKANPVDVYVSGTVICKNGNYGVAYWKNGLLVKVADSVLVNAVSYGGIAINGTDVYMAGVDSTVARPVYWKNGGAAIPLNTGGFHLGGISCIAFQGNDLYIGGNSYTSSGSSPQTAVYWKNGVLNTLTGGANLNAITVSGNNVYFAGLMQTTQYGAYWKNGGQAIIDSSNSASSIAVNGSDVYLGGAGINSFKGHAVYSKNGKVTSLTATAVVRYISTNGADVFMAGDLFNSAISGYYPMYWKNSTTTQLTTATGSTAGVCLNGPDVYVTVLNRDYNTGKILSVFYLKNGVQVSLNSGGYVIASISGMALAPAAQ